jgi:hypothetical protein
LAAREAALAKLEADAKAKVTEANRLVDESMMVALNNQQEKKALQEEVRNTSLRCRGCPPTCR